MNISTSLTGIMGATYRLRWTVSEGICSGQYDEVNIRFNPDTDGDTVQDCSDMCPGGDDRINTDGTGMPDDCDCEPGDATNEFMMLTAAEFEAFVNTEILLASPDSVKRVAEVELSSDAVVEANTADYPKVIFQAGQTIILEPGFTAKAGSDFLARIDFCRDPQTGVGSNLEGSPETASRSKEISTENLTDLAAEELLLAVYPNVIAERAAIRLSLPAREEVSLFLYNHQGQLLRTYLTADYLEKGLHYYQLDASHLPGGFYYLQALTPKRVNTRKLVVQR